MQQEQESGGEPRPPAPRPRDAAAIILLDRSGDTVKALVGRRSSRHVFMPDTYVFPGGRRDARDHALPFSGDLDPRVGARLMNGPPGIGEARARALALAALRELGEETGLACGAPAPRLSCLRLAARAITPPGHVRRYDTRFFLAFADEIGADPSTVRDSAELHDVRWLDIGGDSCLNIPSITRAVLRDVRALLEADPALPFTAPVPFYRTVRGRHVRSLL